MGRFVSAAAAITAVGMVGLLAGCHSSSPVTTTTSTGPTPAIVLLNPTPSADLELGNTLSFIGTPQGSDATSLQETVNYQSSNTAVLTISTAGVACAGSWDSLTTPTVCTPGAVGTAQVTAEASGVSSPPTTIYVHQHIDSVTAVPLTNQPPLLPNQPAVTGSCLSASDTILQRPAQSLSYQAKAFSHGADITSSVGNVTWQVVNPTVATLKTASVTAPISGLLTGQVQVTAGVPGTTTLFASVDGTTSVPVTLTTCPVQSITMSADNAGSNSVSLTSAGTQALTATVTDTQNRVITGTFLDWCSSDPGSVSVGATNCSTGTSTSVTATAQAAGGGGAIIASCTPPNCNLGILPARPVYPPEPIFITVAPPATTTSTSTSSNSLVASTGCGTLIGCISEIANVTSTSGSGSASLAVVGSLPATPNSIVFDPKGSRAFLGTDRGNLGAQGLMVFDPSTGKTAQFTSAAGKVLAVSPDGTSVVLSDTVETPNQVYIFVCGGAGSGICGVTSTVALNITGATAAAFSPDGLKAYIVAGNTLYVYSALSALQPVPLANPASAVAFLANGAFAYLTGASPTITPLRTCDAAVANDSTGNPQVVAAPGTPTFLRALPDGAHLLAVDSPRFDIVTVSGIDTTSTDPANPGCAPPTAPAPAGPVLTNSLAPVNLAQGSFIATQLIVSPDGTKAYLLTSNRGGVLVFDIRSQTTSSIQLAGNVLPLQAALSLNGDTIFVGASDNTVHVLNTITSNDVQQIPIPTDLANLQSGLCANVAFPIQTTLNITAASQNGANTTYTYTLTAGQGLQLDAKVTIQGMGNAGNNGTFAVGALANGTFTVLNPSGSTATNQTGMGSLSFNCNPDLIAISP